MNPASLVLIDTCVWASFFVRKDSPHNAAIERLLDDDQAALIGPILAEILLGCKRDAEADWVASALDGVHYVEVQWDDWRLAAQVGRSLASRGQHLLCQTSRWQRWRSGSDAPSTRLTRISM